MGFYGDGQVFSTSYALGNLLNKWVISWRSMPDSTSS